MFIKKLRVSNFKTFDELEVELDNFNVLIGSNASGKSNFLQIFKFLRDIEKEGLDNAISMQGGIEYLRNVKIGQSKNLSVEVVVVSNGPYSIIHQKTDEKGGLSRKTLETTYKFTIGFKKKGLGFDIVEDILTQKFSILRLETRKGKFEEKENLGEGKIIVSKIKKKINRELKLSEGIKERINEEALFPFIKFIKKERLAPRSLFLESHLAFLLMPPLFSNILITDFDPKLAKKVTPITGKAEIEEDGSNLATVLKKILGNKEKKRKFLNLMKDLLPFVEDMDVEKFVERGLLFKLRETYSKKDTYLPAFLVSDGTVNIAALVIALYFEDLKWLTLIEEPERSIHPYLISRVVEMMKEASEKKQIIATTHNPEMVKHVGLENLLLISRNKEGFSVISKPKEKETVRTFLENELGIEDLYVQNLLE